MLVLLTISIILCHLQLQRNLDFMSVSVFQQLLKDLDFIGNLDFDEIIN